jgi:hypothetical protein
MKIDPVPVGPAPEIAFYNNGRFGIVPQATTAGSDWAQYTLAFGLNSFSYTTAFSIEYRTNGYSGPNPFHMDSFLMTPRSVPGVPDGGAAG